MLPFMFLSNKTSIYDPKTKYFNFSMPTNNKNSSSPVHRATSMVPSRSSTASHHVSSTGTPAPSNTNFPRNAMERRTYHGQSRDRTRRTATYNGPPPPSSPSISETMSPGVGVVGSGRSSGNYGASGRSRNSELQGSGFFSKLSSKFGRR